MCFKLSLNLKVVHRLDDSFTWWIFDNSCKSISCTSLSFSISVASVGSSVASVGSSIVSVASICFKVTVSVGFSVDLAVELFK